MTDEERNEIIRQTRENLDPAKRRAEKIDLARRLMLAPAGDDPVLKWKQEAEEKEAQKIAAKRVMQNKEAEVTAAATDNADWSAWVEDKIRYEREFILEVCGQAIGELSEEVRAEFTAKVDTLRQDHTRERDARHQEFVTFDRQYKILRDLCLREMAEQAKQVMQLQRQVDNLTRALDMKRVDAKLDATRKDVTDSIDEARKDIADLKSKLH
jgi:hypothetical protein